MDIPKFISHILKDKEDNIIAFQSNEEHCHNVAELARQFAGEFGMGDFGYVMGMLHDKGKEKREFQEYIQNVNDIPGHKQWTQEGKAHAYVGGLLARDYYPDLFPILSYPIVGHHSGLDDYFPSENSSGLKNKLSSDLPQEISKNKIESELNIPSFLRNLSPSDYSHVIRMLFSCLKDADCLDTERFMNYETYSLRSKNKSTLTELLPLLEDYLMKLDQTKDRSNVNKTRKLIQDYCREKSVLKKGFYGLTVPTGGGKTLSSLLWAMLHAKEHNLKRIIIAIPYTSIIVQTAGILKNIFGEENVLEHHCNFENKRQEVL